VLDLHNVEGVGGGGCLTFSTSAKEEGRAQGGRGRGAEGGRGEASRGRGSRLRYLISVLVNELNIGNMCRVQPRIKIRRGTMEYHVYLLFIVG
jgi:hypothetical protein